MTGVEILSAEEVVLSTVYNFKTLAIAGGIVFAIAFILSLVISDDIDWHTIIAGIVLGLLLGGFIGGIAGEATRKPTDYITEYKVTVSDEVSMSEFLERYEIVDTEGKIFTVREIDGE